MPCKGIALPAELPARRLILYNNKSGFVNLSKDSVLRQFRYHRFCSDFVFDLIKLVAIRGDFRLYVLPAPCKRTGDTDMDLLMSLVSKGYSESQLLLSLWDCRLPYSTAEREKIGDQLIESVMFISRKKFVSIWAKTMLRDIQPPRHFSGHR